MGKMMIVVGPTGSGKTRSVKNLNPESTVIINVTNKPLPFRGSEKIFSEDKDNLLHLTAWDSIASTIQTISDEGPHIKYIIIDDARYIMEKELFQKVNVVGYSKFTEIALHFQTIMETVENARRDLIVCMMMHDDDVVNDKAIVGKKCKTVGRMVDEHYNPLEVVAICLYCSPSFGKDGKPEFKFYTHKMKLNGVEIPAKTPEDMFSEDTIPNDLNIVFKAIEEYY